MNLLQSAKNYTAKGLSVIATDDNKRSITSWKQYQTSIPNDIELESMFSNPKAKGIAVICGAVSGGLEVIDVDCKYGIDFTEYERAIFDHHSELHSRLKFVKTKSNGYHIYYRCETIEGNQKLAERYATDDEKFKNPNAKQFVLIETRGEAGYVIAPPSAGYQPMDANDIPVISIDERDILHSIARGFNKVIEEVSQPSLPTNGESLKVWDDYNKRGDVVELLKSHGWDVVSEDAEKIYLKRPGQTTSKTSAVIFKSNRIFYPHTTSSSFANKGYNPFQLYTHLECGGNYKKAAKKLSENGYGEKSTDGWFWTITDKGSVSIVRHKFAEWLHGNFVQIYVHNKKSGAYRLVNIENKKIREIFTEDIKKYVKKRLKDDGHINVLESIIKQTNSLFTDSFFEFIDQADVTILQDNATTCYFPFQNFVVSADKNQIKRINYADIDDCIWESQIVERDIQILPDFDITSAEYYKFISLISAGDKDRIIYAMTLIGYILHSHKDRSKSYAVILAEETDDESKGGGTGKGIFFNAISKLIPVVSIDGKTFRPDKTFAWQRVGLGTQLVVIEDCMKNVDFERYYPTITEGMTIEKKNQDELFLRFEESPKIAFTTNYTISNNAEHSRRRQRVLEFAPHFNSKYTPVDEFGHKLFDDWDDDEWTKFYNFMFECVRLYLETGIQMVDNSDKLRRRQIKQQFGDDFLEYFEDIDKNVTHLMSSEWNGFLKRFELERKDFSLKRFSKGLQVASDILQLKYEVIKNRQNNNLREFRIENGNRNDDAVTDWESIVKKSVTTQLIDTQ